RRAPSDPTDVVATERGRTRLLGGVELSTQDRVPARVVRPERFVPRTRRIDDPACEPGLPRRLHQEPTVGTPSHAPHVHRPPYRQVERPFVTFEVSGLHLGGRPLLSSRLGNLGQFHTG